MSVPGHLGARVLTLKWGQTRLSAGGPTVSGDLGLLQGLTPLPPLQTLQLNSLLVSWGIDIQGNFSKRHISEFPWD